MNNIMLVTKKKSKSSNVKYRNDKWDNIITITAHHTSTYYSTEILYL